MATSMTRTTVQACAELDDYVASSPPSDAAIRLAHIALYEACEELLATVPAIHVAAPGGFVAAPIRALLKVKEAMAR